MSSKILVVGHRNPDNDSIAAAVGYAHLKNALAARDGEADAVEYVPARLGPLPVESAWILEQNDIAEPVLIENVNPVERDGEEVKQKVILVDHNEIGQAAPGIENADVVEIIDHHRLGTVETMSPVFFRNQPLGCTATIIYQMYQENHIEIDKTTAGLLCSAIISDTLLFRSPTCTSIDKAAGLALAQIAGLDIEKYAIDMFSAGSNLKGKSDGDIFYQDFKRFTVGNSVFGIGQITSLNAVELKDLRTRMSAYTEKEREQHEIDMMFFMLTNILTESTDLICTGQGAEQLIANAFHVKDEDMENVSGQTGIVKLPGVVSRKKQLAPQIMMALQ